MAKAWISLIHLTQIVQILDTKLQVQNKIVDFTVIQIEFYFNIAMYKYSQVFFGRTYGVYEHCCSTFKCKLHNASTNAIKFRACSLKT